MAGLIWIAPSEPYAWNCAIDGSTEWTVIVQLGPGDPEGGYKVSWKSDNEGVATVSDGYQNRIGYATTISGIAEGTANITATLEEAGVALTASISVGTMYCYDVNGYQYEAPASAFVPAKAPDDIPTNSNMVSRDAGLAWGEGGYVMSTEQMGKRPDDTTLYRVSPSGDTHSRTPPLLYVYPPAQDFIIPSPVIIDNGTRWPSTSEYNAYSIAGSDWASSDNTGITPYDDMSDAGLAWDPVGDASHVTCYVLNLGAIALPSDTTYFKVSAQ